MARSRALSWTSQVSKVYSYKEIAELISYQAHQFLSTAWSRRYFRTISLFPITFIYSFPYKLRCVEWLQLLPSTQKKTQSSTISSCGKEEKPQQHSVHVHKRFSLCLLSNPESTIIFVTPPDGCWLSSEAWEKEKSFCPGCRWLSQAGASVTEKRRAQPVSAMQEHLSHLGWHQGSKPLHCAARRASGLPLEESGWGKCGFIHDSIEIFYWQKYFFTASVSNI